MWEFVTGSGAEKLKAPAPMALEGAVSTISLKVRFLLAFLTFPPLFFSPFSDFSLTFFAQVNGKSYTVAGPIEPEMKLVDFLRKDADCGTGTKIGCGEGVTTQAIRQPSNRLIGPSGLRQSSALLALQSASLTECL